MTTAADVNAQKPKNLYLEGLLKQWEVPGGNAEAEWLGKLRQTAANQVLQSQLPNRREEAWRFTDLSELSQTDFRVAQAAADISDIEAWALPETANSRLVFVNGRYNAELSDVSGLPAGAYVGSLAQLPSPQSGEVVKYLARQAGATEVFTALNTSALADGAVIWVEANVTVEIPIQLLFLSIASDPTISQPRTLVVAKRGASLQLVEQYATVEPATYFTNGVTEIWVEDNAEVNHMRVQQESTQAYHIAKSAIAQARDSRYTCTDINLGGKLSRHNLEIYQTGEQTETQLNGLTVVSGKQLADTHSLISLTKPYGSTAQLHKCIVGDRAHTVFNGKVLVPQAAQLTNAAQLNQNLLLSPKARVDTKPELQITADNVKCSHGATVSQLEPDELFYLQSRGLSESAARTLLVDAFAAEILERIPLQSLRTKLTLAVGSAQ
ncbi:MAG: Fe-S cluster assembly protein SufD [Cyanophyceae cyanobacterium]